MEQPERKEPIAQQEEEPGLQPINFLKISSCFCSSPAISLRRGAIVSASFPAIHRLSEKRGREASVHLPTLDQFCM